MRGFAASAQVAAEPRRRGSDAPTAEQRSGAGLGGGCRRTDRWRFARHSFDARDSRHPLDLLELTDRHLGRRLVGSFVYDGAAGGVVFGVSLRLSLHITLTSRSRLLSSGASPFSGSAEGRRRRWTSSKSTSSASQARRPALCFVLCGARCSPRHRLSRPLWWGMHFISPSEGRLDVDIGEIHFTRSREVELFPDYQAVLADGYSRRQYREGRPHHYGRLGHLFTNSDAHCLMRDGCSARYTIPVASVRRALDHSPMEARFLSPPRSRQRTIPAWVACRPSFAGHLEAELAKVLDCPGSSPLKDLANVAVAMHVAAREVRYIARAPSGREESAWTVHWLLAARSAHYRHDEHRLHDALSRIPRFEPIFLDEARQPAPPPKNRRDRPSAPGPTGDSLLLLEPGLCVASPSWGPTLTRRPTPTALPGSCRGIGLRSSRSALLAGRRSIGFSGTRVRSRARCR